MKTLYIQDEFGQHYRGKNLFEVLPKIEGKVFRQLAGRKTFQFELAGRSYFAKIHTGVGWGEIIKNLLQLRLPIISARNEWSAIQRLHELGLATMHAVAFGERGWSPASRQSFIVTEALLNTVSLEDFCIDWARQPPQVNLKRRLITQLAQISRTLHAGGVCHRDYYLCHFLLHLENGVPTPALRLSLIDLHRALIQRNLGRRWIVKDLAGLYYSAMHIGLSKRDLYRFIRVYQQCDLRTALQTNSAFWNAINKRAVAMYQKLGPAR